MSFTRRPERARRPQAPKKPERLRAIPEQLIDDDETQLEDMLLWYPSQDTYNFQQIVSGMKEFRELSSSITEPSPKRGEKYKHQEFIARMMLFVDYMLIIHRTGTGKTCGAIGSTEKLLRGQQTRDSLIDITYRMLINPSTFIKKVVILVKGKSQKLEFENQLICKCTPFGIYETEETLLKATKKEQRNAIRRAYRKFYTITTYGVFASEVSKLSEDQRKKLYSSTAFIIDEGQYLTSDEEQDVKENLQEHKNTVNRIKTKNNPKKERKSKPTKEEIYRILKDLFRTVTRKKIMILTATPVVNKLVELTSLFNLFPDLNIPKNFDWYNSTLEDLRPYLTRVSYVRELDTGAHVISEGSELSNVLREFDIRSDINIQGLTIVYPEVMSEFQSEVFNQLYQYAGSFSHGPIRASNIVFPDGSISPRKSATSKGADHLFGGFRKHVHCDDYESFTGCSLNEDFKNILSDPESFKSLSIKFYDIIRLVYQNRGNTFIFVRYKEEAILLGLIFRLYNFEEFTGESSIFESEPGKSSGYCDTKSSGQRSKRRVIIPERNRYAILYSGVEAKDKFSNIMNTANSWENRNSDYLRVIIGTPLTQTGLSFDNFTNFFYVTSDWTESGAYQAISRILRATSFNALVDDMIVSLMKHGLTREQAKLQARVDVRIYYMSSISSVDYYNPQTGVNEGLKSIDLRMYSVAEEKDMKNKKVLRMMKQSSVDCQIHEKRNQRENDIDGSKICDYQQCKYNCIDPPPTPDMITENNFDILYSDQIKEEIKEKVKEKFRTTFYISLNNLMESLNQYKKRLIEESVLQIVRNKEVVINRYGFESYLRNDGDMLFLQNEYPDLSEGAVFDKVFYTEVMTLSLPVSISQFNQIHMQQLATGISLQLQSMDINYALTCLDGFIADSEIVGCPSGNIDDVIYILELSVKEYINNSTDPFFTNVVNHFIAKKYLFAEYEPTIEIDKSTEEYTSKRVKVKTEQGTLRYKTAGKPPQTVEYPAKPFDEEKGYSPGFEFNTGGQIVWFHMLYILKEHQSYEKTKAISTVKGKLRIFSPEENEWRDVEKHEIPSYQVLGRMRRWEPIPTETIVTETGAVYETEIPIMGTIDDKGVLRLQLLYVDRWKQSQGVALNKRNISRGKGTTCTNLKQTKIVYYMWVVGAQPYTTRPPVSREEMINRLTRMGSKSKIITAQSTAEDSMDNNLSVWDFPDDMLKFYYDWSYIIETSQRSELCKYLSEVLLSKGWIKYI